MICFKNYKIHINDTYFYCILIINKRSFIDSELIKSILLSVNHFYKKGYHSLMVEVQTGVKSSIQAYDILNTKSNIKKFKKLAIVDNELNFLSRFLINCISKIIYLNSSFNIKTFKTKKNAASWLKE